MDLLAEIKLKAKRVPESARPGIAAIIRHLEQAERCLERGRAGEDDFFTDVVYRTNHAYEGSLKEAYDKLSGKAGSKKTPHEIETYLEKNNVLRSRVLDLMRNYRQEWRNASTHEYELFFSEQESLLAIITVSAFVAVLLDQIVDQLSAQSEQLAFASQVPSFAGNIPNYASLAFPDQIVGLILSFLTTVHSPAYLGEIPPTESYLEMAMANFLRDADQTISVMLEPALQIGTGRILRPDILLQKNNTTVVVEIKRAGRGRVSRDAGVLQVLNYAKLANADRAILVLIPDSPGPIAVETREFKTTGIPTWVTEIYPSSLTSQSIGPTI